VLPELCGFEASSSPTPGAHCVRGRGHHEPLGKGVRGIFRRPEYREVRVLPAAEARPAAQRVTDVLAMNELQPLGGSDQASDFASTADLIVPDAAHGGEAF
jgi:hypothetical protein